MLKNIDIFKYVLKYCLENEDLVLPDSFTADRKNAEKLARNK